MYSMSDNIRQFRKAKGLTQKEFGNLIGQSKQTVWKYEHGAVVNIKYSTIIKMCQVFGCSPNELLGWEGEQCRATSSGRS